MAKSYRVRTDVMHGACGKPRYIWHRVPRPSGAKGQNPHMRFPTRDAAQAHADAANKSGKLAWGENSPFHYIVV